MRDDSIFPRPMAGLAARAEVWALELVGIPSVTGTPDEARFATYLRERLAGLPAFAGTSENVRTIPVAGDPLGRASVAALVRGATSSTLILTGHFDTVRIDDYGDLAPLALRPEPLRNALTERLAAKQRSEAERRALADLESGAFLPGRGLLDMKSGLAAGLAVLEAFAAAPERRGNLLFIAVPDEEANSAGARSVAQALPELAQRWGLSLDAAINLDALVDDGDGAIGRSIALGTVGKLLPSAFVVGRAVHASNAAQGLNAGALAGAIAAEVEWSELLTDRTGEERGAPPTLLGLKDNRTAYDVTTPDRVWAYWNVMSHRRTPADVLSAFAALCRRGADGLVLGLNSRAGASGFGQEASAGDVRILTFDALRGEVLTGGAKRAEAFGEFARSVAARGLDLPEQCRLISDHLWNASGRTGPAVVIGFASLPYLPTELAGEAGRRLETATRAAASAVAERHGVTIGVSRFFPGISDMSYLGQADPAALPTIAANTPAWGFGIPWPAEGGIGGVPIINAGPWGRDYHTPLERVHAKYAFTILPELLARIVQNVLSD